MREQIEKIKNHVKENKDKYIFTATGVAIGAGALFLICLKTGKFNKTIIAIQDGDNSLLCVGDDNKIYQRISNYGNKLGHPGNWVVNTTTGQMWKSQRLAALHYGMTDLGMSRLLANGGRLMNGENLVNVHDPSRV